MSSHTATAVVPAPSTQSVQSYAPADRPKSQQTAHNAPSSATTRAVPSPGRFRHPRMKEIAKRQAATSFTTRNVQTAILNTAALLVSFLTSSWTSPWLTTIIQAVHLHAIQLDAALILNLLRLLLLSNIYFALRPVLPYMAESDRLEDIPLTPSQRALMGLPRSQSNTSISQTDCITPPRYRRSSPSPFPGSAQSAGSGRSISANYSASPLSTSRHTLGFSPTPQQAQQPGTSYRRLSGSPFSPSSPLFNKALYNSTSSRPDHLPNNDFTESTRSLLDGRASTSSFQNSLRRSQSMRDRGRPQSQEPGTPSPNTRERTKVNLQPGLNYKWLYEKGMSVGKNGTIEY